jgi:glycosyltransferase involved in cell wall biosynthesis
MLKIGFDAIALLSPLTGIGQYAKHLLESMDAMPELEVQKFYATGWSKGIRQKPIPLMASRWKSMATRLIPNTYDWSRRLQQRYFTAGIKALKPALYHEPNFLAFEFDGPTAITVHDLSWIRYPHMHPIERVRAMDKYFEPGLRRASRVLTDSEFVKQELIDVFGLRPEIIHPVYLGVEPLFYPLNTTQTSDTLTPLGLGYRQYLLAVGTLEPRKNLGLALRAFMALPPATRKRYPLVLVGMSGWHTSALEQQLAPLIQAGEVRQLGYLSREDLVKVTAGALAMVYPSVYEGFGLPPLEAMACGVPVIAANASSIPEVVGRTGILIDPQDETQLTQAMLTMTQAPDIRDTMAAQALERSRAFSWQQCARQTVDVYRAALS